LNLLIVSARNRKWSRFTIVYGCIKMNTRNLCQIINNYIDKFELINGSVHQEYYKWEIAKAFKPMMDAALASSDEKFPQKLMEVKRLTCNLIDSYTITIINEMTIVFRLLKRRLLLSHQFIRNSELQDI